MIESSNDLDSLIMSTTSSESKILASFVYMVVSEIATNGYDESRNFHVHSVHLSHDDCWKVASELAKESTGKYIAEVFIHRCMVGAKLPCWESLVPFDRHFGNHKKLKVVMYS